MKHSLKIGLTITFGCLAQSFGYQYDPNDFAIEVVDYLPGTGIPADDLTEDPFDDPSSALGRPTVDTIGDGSAAPYGQSVPIVPVYPAWRHYEVVSIGHKGHLVLKFGHKVADDTNNPYGFDFIVFGNSFQKISGSQYWLSGDPSLVNTLDRDCTREPAVVSVSQDGQNWFTFSPDPNFVENPDFSDPNFPGTTTYAEDLYADDFPPTLGRIYDDQTPDYWADATDPTFPFDPNVTREDFKSKTVAQVCSYYGQSAGGTGFDLAMLNLPIDPITGRKWIQYIRIDNPRDEGATPEIDAVSDVSACGDWKHPFPLGDLNSDCRVDLADFALFAENWLVCTWKCQP
ncbi:MAG: hypothetical protein ACYS8S_02650 [Planctomycetota bacterium]|jgi:hypothetical protein